MDLREKKYGPRQRRAPLIARLGLLTTLLLSPCSGVHAEIIGAPSSTSSSQRRPTLEYSKLKALTTRIRGGYDVPSPTHDSLIELNPDYVPPPWQQQQQDDQRARHSFSNLQEQLGDEDENDGQDEYYIQTQSLAFTPSQILSHPSQSPLENIRRAFLQFHHASPSLARCMVACIATFLAWQIPALQPMLQHWFVASRYNVVGAGRWPSLFLSAVSHGGFIHLLFNLATLLSFGPSVQQTLQQSGGGAMIKWPLWPLLLGSALSGSAFYLWLDRGGGGGCMGLSAVTLGLLSVYTRLHPTTRLQIMLAGIFPVRLQAQTLLKCLLVWSTIGALRASGATMGKSTSNIAHAAHLGGLLFGLAYHELLWKRRWQVERFLRNHPLPFQQATKSKWLS